MKTLIRAAFATAALIACAAPALADTTVSGNYLQVGINTGGSLIDFGGFTGIKFDPTGSGNFSSPIDFLTPGIPFAFYSIGVNNAFGVAGGGSPANPFGTTTIDLSGGVGSPFVVTKNGSYGGLSFKQVLSFDNDSQMIHTSVTFKNVSSTAVNNVVYGVGIDPDQDAFVTGNPFTANTILGQGVNAQVSAYGPATGYSITMRNTTGWVPTRASISAGWVTDPYNLAAGFNDGNGDNTINLAFTLGDFSVNQEKTIGYDYAIAAVPEPETYGMMLLGLGLVGVFARRRK